MKNAFTLLEAIIVISVVLILVGLPSLSLISPQKGGDLEAAKVIVSEGIREAQSNSLANLGDVSWGVHFESNRLVIFADTGSGYNPSDQANNRMRLIPEGTSLSADFGGGQDLVFTKGEGKVVSPGIITLSAGGIQAQLTINSEGRLDYF